ncbi:MAG: methyl-accepting chemotaxis protein [Solibacillus sp.]
MAPNKKLFNLRRKLVLFVGVLALVTYSTSFIFIEYIQPTFFPSINEVVFQMITYALGITWSCVLAAVFSIVIVRPLQRLEYSANRVAEGKIGEDVEMPKTNDEIRSVAEAFQLMVTNLRTMVKSIEDNFKTTNTTVIDLSEQTSTAARNADSIAYNVGQISDGAEASALAVQETVEAIEGSRELATEVNERALSSANKSEVILSHLTHTMEEIQILVDSIQKIASGNENVLTNIQTLEQNTSEVEHIIGLVGNIAAQTNLLALNASIEAAHAGDYGKGFAVVAEEVRSLADESAKAVQGITNLIQTMQHNVNVVVTKMNEQVTFAVNESARVSKTTETVEDMASSVQEMAANVIDISKLIERQMGNIEKTAFQSQEVAAITQQTSASAQEVRSVTEEQAFAIDQVEKMSQALKIQSEDLYRVIQQFDYSK